MKLSYAINSKTGDAVVPQGRKITNSLYKELQKSKIEQVEVAQTISKVLLSPPMSSTCRPAKCRSKRTTS